jgi:acetyltransferase-like isoleucine patch superfamily enzyme/dTDP-4-dehydrorhamnose 3,5-epimerase-like enzyme
MIHPTAIVDTTALGAGCRVGEYASIGAEVTLADGVGVGAGARLLGRIRIDEAATIGANVVLGITHPSSSDGITVGRNARIDANATVLPGVAIGRGAVVEAGSAVDADVPAHAIVRGSPARIVGYVDTFPEPTEPEVLDPSDLATTTSTGVPGVVLYPVTTARDLRGGVAAMEFDELPFVPQRVFAVYGVPNESVRGAHAHRTCAQLLFCMSGEVSCVADDGTHRQEFRLSGPEVGLYLPPMVWGMQYRYSRDAVLVVLAQFAYEPDDYIRDYEEFLELATADGSV